MANPNCGCLGCVEERSSDPVSMIARANGGAYLLPGDHGAASRCLAVYPNRVQAETALRRWHQTTERLVAADVRRTDTDPIERTVSGLEQDVNTLTNAALTLAAVDVTSLESDAAIVRAAAAYMDQVHGCEEDTIRAAEAAGFVRDDSLSASTLVQVEAFLCDGLRAVAQRMGGGR